MEEEFRLLTLQIIGEAILSLPPDECDRVFPQLYLPVMEESNRRVLEPWRQLYPLTAYQYNQRVSQLNKYIISIIRARRAAHAANSGKPPAKPDILDRVLAAAEVCIHRPRALGCTGIDGGVGWGGGVLLGSLHQASCAGCRMPDSTLVPPLLQP